MQQGREKGLSCSREGRRATGMQTEGGGPLLQQGREKGPSCSRDGATCKHTGGAPATIQEEGLLAGGLAGKGEWLLTAKPRTLLQQGREWDYLHKGRERVACNLDYGHIALIVSFAG